MVEPKLVDEQNQTEAQEREAEADPGPHEGIAGWRVADLRLVWLVLGPRPGHIGSAGYGCEGGVDQEVRSLQRLVLIQAVGGRPAGDEAHLAGVGRQA